MMSLTEFGDPGLQLLPYHKVIGGLSRSGWRNWRRGSWNCLTPRPLT